MTLSTGPIPVLLILVTTASRCPAQNAPLAYPQQLKSLDNARVESVCIARDSLRSLMAQSNETDRASLFRAFRDFYFESAHTTSPAFTQSMKPFTQTIPTWFMESSASPDSVQALLRASPDIRKAVEPWIRCGYSITQSEGDLYPDQDPATLLEFAAKLPPDLKLYLEFRAQEDRQPIVDDAALQLTWEQLRARIERWEAFARSHPELEETKSEVQPTATALGLLYILGVDNTAIFDRRTGLLEPQLVESWKKFVAADRLSQYHALIADLLPKVEVERRITAKDRPLFQQAGLQQPFDNCWHYFQIQTKKHRSP